MEFTATTPLIFEATNSQHPLTIANVYGVGWIIKTTFDEITGFKTFEEAKRNAECIMPFTVEWGA
jgi:hypothetical protein